MSKQFQRLSKALSKGLALPDGELERSFYLADRTAIPVISRIREQVFAQEIQADDAAYLQWRYFSRRAEPSTYWVFEYRGEIIGGVGTEPIELLVDGQQVPALRTMDIIVDPKFNGYGIGAWMNFALQQKSDCLLASGGNKDSLSMLKKMYSALPVRKNYKLLLRSNEFLAARLPPLAQKLLSPVVNLLLSAYFTVLWFCYRLFKPRVVCQSVALGDFIDGITGPGVIGKIKGLRSQEYMRWRFQQNPRAKVEVICAKQGDQLLGYLIYDCTPAKDSAGFSVGRVIDWDVYAADSRADAVPVESIVAALFLFASKALKGLKVEHIHLTLNDAVTADAISKIGYSQRFVDDRFFVYSKDEKIAQRLLDTEDWYYSYSDSDGV